MDLYTRRQLTLLLVVVLVAGAGLGIDRWRRTHPEQAERLEAFDRSPAAAAIPRAQMGRAVSHGATAMPVANAAASGASGMASAFTARVRWKPAGAVAPA